MTFPGKFTNIQATFIPLVFVLLGIYSNWNTYYQAELPTLALFGLSVLAVGIVEEFVFRGALFPLCIQAFKNTNRPILYAAVLSGSVFGMVHFVNVFSQPDNFIGITSQVFFALSIGVFFSGLMVRTENILIPALIHALINFGFGADELHPLAEELSEGKEGDGVEWNSVIPTTLFFAFILAGGVYMILKSDVNHVLKKLGIE
jgi:membrane protease YdiL (CAAX protease family)